jgi:hypothetical protein
MQARTQVFSRVLKVWALTAPRQTRRAPLPSRRSDP